MLAVIPARGGSKGINRKNIVPLAGRPLISYAIEKALKAARIDRVLVTTDDPEIAEAAVAAGAEAPFLRPPELAGDDVPSGLACLHALDWLRRNDGAEHAAFALVQATNPLIASADIDAAVDLFEREKPDAVISLTPFGAPIESVFELDASGAPTRVLAARYGVTSTVGRRQSFGPRYIMCGAVTVLRAAMLAADQSYYYDGRRARAIVVPPERGVDIDDALDLALAELLLSRAKGG